MPISLTPSARAHWHAIRPTPPAAAWNRIVSAALQPVSLPEQVLHGQALQHHRRALLERDLLRQLDDSRHRHRAQLRIRTERPLRIGDAITGLERFDAGPDRVDDARALETKPVRQRTGIEAGAVVHVDVVQADRMLPDPHFVRSGIRHVHFAVFENLGAAVSTDDDGLGFHELSLVMVRAGADVVDRDRTEMPASTSAVPAICHLLMVSSRKR